MNFEKNIPDIPEENNNQENEYSESDPEMFRERQNLQMLAMEKFADLHTEFDTKEEVYEAWAKGAPAEIFDECLKANPEILEEFQKDPDTTAEEVLFRIEKGQE